MVLVLCFLKMRARAGNIFFSPKIFDQLTNIDLPLNDRVYEKMTLNPTSSLQLYTSCVQRVATFWRTDQKR